jgi:hypothetical protein
MADSIAPDNRKRNSEIIRLYLQGVTFGRISVLCKVSRNTVAGVVRRSNLAYRGGQRRPFDDLSGQIFGRLLVIRRAENFTNGNTQFLCECECGGSKIVQATNLKNGSTQSCGCLQKERVRAANLERYHRQRFGAAA